MVQAASLRDKEVDDRRGKVEILGFRGMLRGMLRGMFRGICRRLAGAGSMLRQPDSLQGMYLLELVLAQEIQDRTARIALHRLRSDALDVDVAGQRGCAQQVLLSRKQ